MLDYGLELSSAISFVIIAINLIMKEVIIGLFTWVGDATRSIQITRIVNGIFIALFLNTGFIILLANANLKAYGLPIFHGPFDDYDPIWYS